MIETPASLDFDVEFDAVVNASGLAHQDVGVDYEQFHRINVEGSKHLADFTVQNNIRCFLHISSISIYGSVGYTDREINEDTVPAPDDFYGVSKLESEIAVTESLRASTCKLVVLRPATVIGKGDKGNIAVLIRAIRDRKFVCVLVAERTERVLFILGIWQLRLMHCLKLRIRNTVFIIAFRALRL